MSEIPRTVSSLSVGRSESNRELRKKSDVSKNVNALGSSSSISVARSTTSVAASIVSLNLTKGPWPIVYHPKYTVKIAWLKRCQPIEITNSSQIVELLAELLEIGENIHSAREATEDELLIAHSRKYLKSLKWSCNVARITDICVFNFIPNVVIQKTLLKPLRFQTYGTLLAGQLALERGWAINVGGGFSNCSAVKGSGFSLYADITLLARYALDHSNRVKKLMIVDLGAHQGNGYANDLGNDARVFIMDAFNAFIQPLDVPARKFIDCRIELPIRTRDNEYLEKVETNFLGSLKKFTPDLLIYHAGVDVLDGDPFGRLKITPDGVIRRDTLLFVVCRQRRIPIVMLTYACNLDISSSVVANSIKALLRLGLISNA